jgi:hypothetical protein
MFWGPHTEVEIMKAVDSISVIRTHKFHAELLLIQTTSGLVDGFTV